MSYKQTARQNGLRKARQEYRKRARRFRLLDKIASFEWARLAWDIVPEGTYPLPWEQVVLDDRLARELGVEELAQWAERGGERPYIEGQCEVCGNMGPQPFDWSPRGGAVCARCYQRGLNWAIGSGQFSRVHHRNGRWYLIPRPVRGAGTLPAEFFEI